MQVYIPAIEGHVPDEMVWAMCALFEFAYIAWRNVHDTNCLEELDDALQWFQLYCEIFWTSSVHPTGFNLLRQHSLTHYTKLIQAFGSPNGLCSSITEFKHRDGVKGPWWHSSCNDPLPQMLITNQRNDKLAAFKVDFVKHGKLDGTPSSSILKNIPCIIWNLFIVF